MRLTALPMNLFNMPHDHLVVLLTLRNRTSLPGVITTPADLQNPANQSDGKTFPDQFSDQPKLHFSWSCEKKAAAAFKIWLTFLSCAFSFLSAWISFSRAS